MLVATVRGHSPLAIFLLEQGADPNFDGMGYTALHWAAGTWETALTGPKGIKAQPGNDWAALAGLPTGKVELVKALLAHGAESECARGQSSFADWLYEGPPAAGPAKQR